jgi:hypothetical protein
MKQKMGFRMGGDLSTAFYGICRRKLPTGPSGVVKKLNRIFSAGEPRQSEATAEGRGSEFARRISDVEHVNEWKWSVARNPLRVRGGRDIKKNDAKPPLMERTGWSLTRKAFLQAAS